MMLKDRDFVDRVNEIITPRMRSIISTVIPSDNLSMVCSLLENPKFVHEVLTNSSKEVVEKSNRILEDIKAEKSKEFSKYNPQEAGSVLESMQELENKSQTESKDSSESESKEFIRAIERLKLG